jgi:3',5'-cyclic AMP phosphodiesterase CpdA
MRIAHISDLHFTSFYRDNNLNSIKFLLKQILNEEIDHIIITGDLTDNAERNDFLALRKLFSDFNILKSNKLSLVIGNHDIFGGVQTAEELFSFPKRCKAVDYEIKINEFYNYFKETFDGILKIDPENIFPFAKEVNGVLLVGLNTIDRYSSTKNIFASNGIVHIEQFNSTVDILKNLSPKFDTKIIMLHHHFNKIKITKGNGFSSFWQNIERQTMKLRKKKRLLNLFEDFKIDLVLHGHYHEMANYKRKEIRFLNAGASFKGNRMNILSYNLIEIKNRSISIKTNHVYPRKADLIFDFDVRQNELLKEEKLFISEILRN